MPVPDVAVRLVHHADTYAGGADYAANGVRAVAGLQAFRGYSWMTDARTFNTAGNFRGMVVSSRWATAYRVVSPVANAVGNVATVASIAANTVDMAPQFEAIYRSNASDTEKSLRYLSLAGTVAQKTLIGIVSGGVHLIYLPLMVGCDAATKAGGGIGNAANVCSTVVKQADSYVQRSAEYVTDPVNQRRWIQNVITIVLK